MLESQVYVIVSSGNLVIKMFTKDKRLAGYVSGHCSWEASQTTPLCFTFLSTWASRRGLVHWRHAAGWVSIDAHFLWDIVAVPWTKGRDDRGGVGVEPLGGQHLPHSRLWSWPLLLLGLLVVVRHRQGLLPSPTDLGAAAQGSRPHFVLGNRWRPPLRALSGPEHLHYPQGHHPSQLDIPQDLGHKHNKTERRWFIRDERWLFLHHQQSPRIYWGVSSRAELDLRIDNFAAGCFLTWTCLRGTWTCPTTSWRWETRFTTAFLAPSRPWSGLSSWTSPSTGSTWPQWINMWKTSSPSCPTWPTWICEATHWFVWSSTSSMGFGQVHSQSSISRAVSLKALTHVSLPESPICKLAIYLLSSIFYKMLVLFLSWWWYFANMTNVAQMFSRTLVTCSISTFTTIQSCLPSAIITPLSRRLFGNLVF